ncbi:universal stress protein [Ornithinimicrobium pekingense]|uniref:Universal stress protein n=1 Tax=Ornithinimicrobium pekingense TaxID=384677 RepID=A0ABQ2F9G8_9MICO|nr:universal stress protein [Ornithinimicrobium pekingense]GGK65805.1 universal stress protein [Ornithinimicrobium pekingense]
MSELDGRAVVVGADGGGTDGPALRWAALHASRTGLPLLAVHASEPEALAARAAGAGAPDITVLLEAEDVRAGSVRATVAELAATFGIEASVSIERGSPVRALLEHQDRAALIVLGTGRKGALEEFVLGTTSIGVAAHATVPVVILNPEVDVDGLTRGRIAVAVDGSPDSEAAARAAVAYAARTGCALTAVTAWYLEVVDGYVVTEPDSPEWRQIEQAREAMLRDVLRPALAEHPGVQVELDVRRGPIVGTLREVAREVDLVVVGSRGRGSFAGRLLGSVSQRVMRAARCPVMVVTSPRR